MDLGDMVDNYKTKEVVDAAKEYHSKKPTDKYKENETTKKIIE